MEDMMDSEMTKVAKEMSWMAGGRRVRRRVRRRVMMMMMRDESDDDNEVEDEIMEKFIRSFNSGDYDAELEDSLYSNQA